MLGNIGRFSIALILSSLLLFGEDAPKKEQSEESGKNNTIIELDEAVSNLRGVIKKEKLRERKKYLESLHQEIKEEDKLLNKMKKDDEIGEISDEIAFTNVDTSTRIVCEAQDRPDPLIKWLFSATDISMGAFFLSEVGSVVSTFTANIGLRYNLSQKTPATIAERGFSIAGRVGVAYLSYDIFVKNGVGIPVSAEISYVFRGGFLMSVGAEMIYAPILGDYKESLSVEVYGEMGFANRSGGALRVGYVVYNDALLRNGGTVNPLAQQPKYSPLKGNISASIHFKL